MATAVDFDALRRLADLRTKAFIDPRNVQSAPASLFPPVPGASPLGSFGRGVYAPAPPASAAAWPVWAPMLPGPQGELESILGFQRQQIERSTAQRTQLERQISELAQRRREEIKLMQLEQLVRSMRDMAGGLNRPVAVDNSAELEELRRQNARLQALMDELRRQPSPEPEREPTPPPRDPTPAPEETLSVPPQRSPSPGPVAHLEDDEEAMRRRKGKRTLPIEVSVRARRKLRGGMLAVLFYISLRRRLLKLNIAQKELMQDLTKFVAINETVCIHWLRKVLFPQLRSIMTDPELDLSVSGPLKSGFFGRGMTKQELDTRIMKIQVRTKGIIDALLQGLEKELPVGLQVLCRILVTEGTKIPNHFLMPNEGEVIKLGKNNTMPKLKIPLKRVIVLNFIVSRILIYKILLRPWKVGIGPNTAPSETTVENLRTIATLVYRITRFAMSPDGEEQMGGEGFLFDKLMPSEVEDILTGSVDPKWFADQVENLKRFYSLFMERSKKAPKEAVLKQFVRQEAARKGKAPAPVAKGKSKAKVAKGKGKAKSTKGASKASVISKGASKASVSKARSKKQLTKSKSKVKAG